MQFCLGLDFVTFASGLDLLTRAMHHLHWINCYGKKKNNPLIVNDCKNTYGFRELSRSSLTLNQAFNVVGYPPDESRLGFFFLCICQILMASHFATKIWS